MNKVAWRGPLALLLPLALGLKAGCNSNLHGVRMIAEGAGGFAVLLGTDPSSVAPSCKEVVAKLLEAHDTYRGGALGTGLGALEFRC